MAMLELFVLFKKMVCQTPFSFKKVLMHSLSPAKSGATGPRRADHQHGTTRRAAAKDPGEIRQIAVPDWLRFRAEQCKRDKVSIEVSIRSKLVCLVPQVAFFLNFDFKTVRSSKSLVFTKNPNNTRVPNHQLERHSCAIRFTPFAINNFLDFG